MKKIAVLLSVILCVSNLFSQDLSTTYNQIADVCGIDIIQKIHNNRILIKDITPKSEISIAVLPIPNNKGEITQISVELTPLLVTKMQASPQPGISAFDNIQFFVPSQNRTEQHQQLI